VNGEVKGDIHATERLELAGAARVEGNVHYQLLEMAAGARIDGRMVHLGEAPKRLPRPEADSAPVDAEPAKA
jgi:cytoskeletal protein CcmA (bactofilin family)